MTTYDLSGRLAAIRPSAGFRRLPRLLCGALLCVAAVPAFAQPADAVAASASVAPSTALAVRPVASDAMPMPERSAFFGGDVTRMIAAAPVVAPAAEMPADKRVQTLLRHALALLGTPYRWGGTTTRGFDCSGLVGYVFQTTLGIDLPRVSRDMARTGELISERSALNPGDLVFFGRRGRVNHVGIYLGQGQFVHAPRTGKDVMVSRLDSGYWSHKFLEARRIAGI